MHASTRPISTEATTAEARSEARVSGSSRNETDFCLRYAARVLERYARMWHRIDATVRLLALFSGTSAFGALLLQSPGWTIAAGLVFAFLQSVEYSLTPARREQDGRAARALYLDVLAKDEQLSDAELKVAFRAAALQDPVIPPDALKRLAYNDVAEEVGAKPDHYYPRTRHLGFVDWVA